MGSKPAVAKLSPSNTWTNGASWLTVGVQLAERMSSDEIEPGNAVFDLNRVVRYVSDAVIVTNAATERIVLWNESAATMFGTRKNRRFRCRFTHWCRPTFGLFTA
jgi:PAS domain-containing protein